MTSGVRMVGYKLLTESLASVSAKYGRVTYSPEWQEIPGNGAYLGLTVPGLLRGAYAPILAEMEGEEPTGVMDDGEVITVRRARILRTARLDTWAWVRVAIRAAKRVAHLSTDPKVAALIEAAERCERERTPESEAAAARASEPAVSASEAAVWAREATAWVSEAAGIREAAKAEELRASLADLVAEAWPGVAA